MRKRSFLLLEVLLALMIVAGCAALLLTSGASQARTLKKAAADLAVDWGGRELLALSSERLRTLSWQNRAKEEELFKLEKELKPIYGRPVTVKLVGTIDKVKETQTGSCYLVRLDLYQGKESDPRRTTFLFFDPQAAPLPAA